MTFYKIRIFFKADGNRTLIRNWYRFVFKYFACYIFLKNDFLFLPFIEEKTMAAGGASPNPTIKAIIDFIKEERAFVVLAVLVVIFLIWPKPRDFKLQDWKTAFIIAITTFTVAIISITFLYNIISKGLNEQIRKIKIKDDLHAQVVNLQVNFQTLTTMGIIASFLLSFFGIQTYQSLIEKQTTDLETKIKAQQTRIDSLSDSTTAILRKLPVGTIMLYSGKKKDIDTLLWAICDGKSHGGVPTPNLLNRFILGTGWNGIGKQDSTPIHEQLTLLANEQTPISIQSGDGIFKNFNTIKYSISHAEGNNNPLPPYYALAYIMKIK